MCHTALFRERVTIYPYIHTMTNTKKSYPHNYMMDTKSIPQRNRNKKLLGNAMVQQQLITVTNNLKQLLRNYTSEYDRFRGELAQRPHKLAGETLNRLEQRKTELEHLASKLLTK